MPRPTPLISTATSEGRDGIDSGTLPRTLAALAALIVLAGVIALPTVGHAGEPEWTTCPTSIIEFDAPEPTGFERKRHRVFLSDVDAEHSAQDAVVGSGESVTVEGKFAYGDISKDLEKEPVTLWLGTCDDWLRVGDARTDGDGRARVEVDTTDLGAAGVYPMIWTVGDGSTAMARLHVIPEGTRMVVFDIDGTLTLSDGEMVDQLLDESDAVEAVQGAAEMTRLYAERGYVILYLTARPYWLLQRTRRWLASNQFADGAIRTTDRHRDMIPRKNGGVVAFKAGQLRRLQTIGAVVEAAYGNKGTDLEAYAAAELDASRIWMRSVDGSSFDGAQTIQEHYLTHLEHVRELPAVDQPFAAREEGDR